MARTMKNLLVSLDDCFYNSVAEKRSPFIPLSATAAAATLDRFGKIQLEEIDRLSRRSQKADK